MVRLVEGIRLFRKLPESKLLLSGSGAFDPVPEAEVMAEVAVSLGVDPRKLVLEPKSRDTKDQATMVQRIVGGDRFVLVTSAYHMPRAVSLFRNRGMRPIPAPAGHWVKQKRYLHPGALFPSAAGIWKSERAIREYLGIAWALLRGQIQGTEVR